MAIRVVTICGSVRPGNYTAQALRLVADELSGDPEITVESIDLADTTLALPGQVVPGDSSERLQASVLDATALVIATPEYHGSFSSAVKLAIENLGFPSVLRGKPVALLGVAAGEIGAIKSLEHLRSVCSHVGAIVLPNLVSVARVREVFDADGNCLDARIEKRIRGLAAGLVEYVRGSVCPRFILESMVRAERSNAGDE